MTTYRLFIYLLLMLFSTTSSAFLRTIIVSEITPENSASESVSIYLVDSEPDCAGVQVWIDAPSFFTKASIQIGKSNSEDLKIGVEVKTLPSKKLISEQKYLSEEAEFVTEHLERAPDKFNFLIGGFHGVFFCTKRSLLPNITIELSSYSQRFILAPISDWFKNELKQDRRP